MASSSLSHLNRDSNIELIEAMAEIAATKILECQHRASQKTNVPEVKSKAALQREKIQEEMLKVKKKR